MKKSVFVCFIFILVVSFVAAQNAQENVSAEAFKLIQNSVFEVVVDKSPDNRMKYDKELDIESIPFKIRNDKYESIGTAFAISKTEVATAFHVLDLGRTSLVHEKYYIRDSSHAVYEIDQIMSASNERDVVTCTVKDRTFSSFMPITEKWTVGDTAFTVGNALGEGIVMRQGLILGTDPEPISGRWDILKTSADSSPGNSGGPLITREGSVLGVVVARKDNIQYTIPSAVLKAAPHDKLVYFTKTRTGHAILANKLSNSYNANVKLPANYSTVRKNLCDELYKQYVDQMEKLFSEAPKYLDGPDNTYLIDFSPSSPFPEVDFVDGDDNSWALSSFKTNGVKLPDDGQLSSAKLSDFTISRIKKPRSADLKQINTDPKFLFDLILKNNKSVRRFYNNDYRVLSFGEPLTVGRYKDMQGKTWITTEWLIDYADQMQICYILPLPGGPIMVSTVQQTANRDMYQWDIKKVCDHIHAAYVSDFDNWETFLSLKEFIPDFLKTLKFSADNKNNSFNFNYENVSIKSDKNVFEWSKKSELFLTLAYNKTDSGIKYGIDYIMFQYDGIKNNFFSFRKNNKPDSKLGRKAEDRWDVMLKKSYPYDGKPYVSSENNTSSLGAMVDAKNEKDILYSLYLNMEDADGQEDVLKRFKSLKNGINIK
ncbi:MAG: serine protease [Termitinemataceae bacterium]|nr:MAG: serine protease [Termitinemataceae bacterium]